MIYNVYRIINSEMVQISEMMGSNYFIMNSIIESLKKYVKEQSKIENTYIEVETTRLNNLTNIVDVYVARVDESNTIRKLERTLVKSLKAVTEYESSDKFKYKFYVEKGDKHSENNKKPVMKWK